MSHAFTLLQPDPEPPPIPQQQVAPPNAEQRQASIGLTMLALRALSQRFVAALLNLFGVVTLLSAWWLFMHVSADPTMNQLILVGIYAGFVAVMNYLTRMKK